MGDRVWGTGNDSFNLTTPYLNPIPHTPDPIPHTPTPRQPFPMQSRGFTLIELLIVMAIIAILVTISFIPYMRSFEASRDSQRKHMLSQAQEALDFYFIRNRSYPSTNGEWRGSCAGFGGYDITGVNGYIPDIAPTFLSHLPTDPFAIPRPRLDPACNSSEVACFIYRSDGTNYKLVSNCGIETKAPESGKPFYDPIRPGYGLMVCSKDVTACQTW